MANVRCPMCSKLNPPEAEICAYCGARLKPVRPSSPTPAKPQANQPDDEPDWLRALRSNEPETSSESASQGQPSDAVESDADVPDWLARIREKDKEAEEIPADGDPFAETPKDETDWMKDLQGEIQLDEEAGSDWLSRLGEDNSTAPQNSQPLSPSTPDLEPNPESETPDWLRSFSDEMSASSQASESASVSPEDDADWMKTLSSWQAEPTDETPAKAEPIEGLSAEGEDEFSWLSSLGADSGEPPIAPEKEETGAGFGLTSFLSELEGSTAQEPPTDQSNQTMTPEEGGLEWTEPEAAPDQGRQSSGFGLTGFLSQINEPGDSQTPETGEFLENAFPGASEDLPAFGAADTFEPAGSNDASTFMESAASSDNALPDWLSGEPSPSEASVPAEETNLQDWLKGLGSESEIQAAEEAPSGSADVGSTEAGVPDWLMDTPQEQPPAAASASDQGIPDWLSGYSEPSAPEPFAESQPSDQSEPSEAFSAAAGLPTWLSGDMDSQAPVDEPAVSETTPAAESAEMLPDWFSQLEEPKVEEPQPQHISAFEPEPQPDTAVPVSQEPEAVSSDENVPDWLRDFHAQPSAAAGESTPPLMGDEELLVSPLAEGDQPFGADLPDWLAEESTTRAAEDQTTSAELAGEDLSQAELPEWVKEMRPIESIIPGETQVTETDQRVEKAGPLAGMRGVLPADDLSAHYRKPPVYSMKLHVSEKQRGQSSLLDNLLAQESQPLQLPPERSHAQGVLLRLLIALLLLVALAVPMLPSFRFDAIAIPALYPKDMQDMFEKIDKSQSSGAPVLLAVDYDPGLSGEMRLAASPVVQQLLAKNTQVVIVSTTPSGSALGSQLLTDAQSANTQYAMSEKVVNLGYLPGGTTSLLEFAQDPQRAAPITVDGRAAWQDTFLKNASGLQGFSQIILMTDRAETGRAWVEQVQPLVSKVPLYIVASAQAAPLLEPYVSSGQVAGMVRGLLGGAMYSRLANQSGGAVMAYLSIYQVGVLLALALVLIGGLVSGGISLLRRNAKDEE